MNKRFDEVEQDNLYVIAVFLHPMYKARWCKFSSDSLMERKTKDLVTQMMTEVKLVPKTTAVTEQKSQARNQNFMSFMDESEPVEQVAPVSLISRCSKISTTKL